MRLAEVLRLKKEIPKYIQENAIPFTKMLNKASAEFIKVAGEKEV